MAQDSFVRQINLISPAKGFLEHDHLALQAQLAGRRRGRRARPARASAREPAPLLSPVLTACCVPSRRQLRGRRRQGPAGAARAEIERVKKARRAETLNVMRYAAAKKAGKTARDAYLSKGGDEAVKTERE